MQSLRDGSTICWLVCVYGSDLRMCDRRKKEIRSHVARWWCYYAAGAKSAVSDGLVCLSESYSHWPTCVYVHKPMYQTDEQQEDA